MLFKKKEKKTGYTPPRLTLYSGAEQVYDGLLINIPLKESVVLEKSVEFFDDPEPCHIHRRVVRTRLTDEIQAELEAAPDERPGPLLLSYADFPGIDRCVLTKDA